MPEKRSSFDGAERRRLYLFRHGSVDYVNSNGEVVPDPDDVSLNDRGRAEADAMRALIEEIPLDRAVCSGLRRTVETATIVLDGRDLPVDIDSGLEEIRHGRDRPPEFDLFRDVAYSHWHADEPGSRFLGGETYAGFYARISSAIEGLVGRDGWHDMAIFAHGGTNAAVLGWVTGLGLNAFGVFDQATCCLNVIDFDVDRDSSAVIRKTVRGMNITAVDPAKHRRTSGDMEMLASHLMRFDT
jgi:probable phosphoglycerate mutase